MGVEEWRGVSTSLVGAVVAAVALFVVEEEGAEERGEAEDVFEEAAAGVTYSGETQVESDGFDTRADVLTLSCRTPRLDG